MEAANAPKQRILFVIDGSGSMKELWNNETKWNVAKETLINLVDSISKKNKSVSFAVRVLGHQFPRQAENCQDTKLEIPFTQEYQAQTFRAVLDKVNPQGHTPIAYSLRQASTDFTPQQNTINTVILITDGFETCNGDPCEVALSLRQKNIVISPYIIGLGVDVKYHDKFNCVGTFVDVKDKTGFNQTLKKIVQETVSKTTCQIVIKNKNGKHVTDRVEYSLYDQVTGNLVNSYVYVLNKNQQTDTLYLNPRGLYSMQVHSNPSLIKNNIQIKAGTHTIIPFVLDQGAYATESAQKSLLTVVRRDDEIVQVQPPLEEKKFLTQNKYEVEVLTLPMTEQSDIQVSEESKQSTHINTAGSVMFGFEVEGIAAVLDDKNQKVWEINFTRSRIPLELQPANYTLVYRANSAKKSLSTKILPFKIESGKNTVLMVN
jgi:Ca-activated chloride channel homolog